MKIVTSFIFALLFYASISGAEGLRTVTEVLDADTVILDKNETIRLIGVDAPEAYNTRGAIRHFAEEAHKFVKKICEGKKVRVEFDGEKHRDRYKRTWAYLYLEDGTFINAEIIKMGYGFCYVKFPFRFMDAFRQYQREAIEKGLGLWPELINSKDMVSLIKYYERFGEKGREMARECRRYMETERGQ